MVKNTKNVPWLAFFNAGLIFILAFIGNSIVRKNGNSTFSIVLAIGIVVLMMFLFNIIFLKILRVYKRNTKGK
jgi:hypothetical protein